MGVLVSNNAWGELSVPVTPEATLLLLGGAQGDRFPQAMESVSWFYATLADSENNIEIVKCVSRQGDTLTVVRGVDGTQAKPFMEGARVELRPTAALFNDKASKDEVTSALGALEKTLKDADSADYKALERLIQDVKNTYLTKADFDAAMKKKDESNSGSYLTKEDGKKLYVPLAGGTMTGGLTINPSTGSGLVVKSSVGAGVSVQGGDVTISSYRDVASGRTFGGNLTASGTIKAELLRSTSDIRAKNGIHGFSSGEGLDIANQLRPVHFKWNSTGDEDVGFVAQEVLGVLPEVVGEDDGMLSLNYSAMVAVAIAAVQDLYKQVEDIKCRIK